MDDIETALFCDESTFEFNIGELENALYDRGIEVPQESLNPLERSLRRKVGTWVEKKYRAFE